MYISVIQILMPSLTFCDKVDDLELLMLSVIDLLGCWSVIPFVLLMTLLNDSELWGIPEFLDYWVRNGKHAILFVIDS